MSRYFGGTLLGVSGLIIAYRTAAAPGIQSYSERAVKAVKVVEVVEAINLI